MHGFINTAGRRFLRGYGHLSPQELAARCLADADNNVYWAHMLARSRARGGKLRLTNLAIKNLRKRAYVRWGSMLQRCFNPNASGYCDYGARGITVCERWLKFENYYADTGDSPPIALTTTAITNRQIAAGPPLVSKTAIDDRVSASVGAPP
jgi:hypothetical protein